MKGYTDIHSHFLYGIDDGAQSRSEMEAMLDAAYADNVASIFATPHIVPGVYSYNLMLIRQRLMEARSYCHMKGYQMDLYAGAEIMYTPALERFVVEKQLPTLGDSEYVLVEFVPDISYKEIESATGIMERSGYDVIIAHAERYDCMYQKGNAYRLKEKHEIHYQLNCESILKGRGFIKDHHIKKWLTNEMIDFVATDSHDTYRRFTQMHAAHAALMQNCRKDYADKLVGFC